MAHGKTLRRAVSIVDRALRFHRPLGVERQFAVAMRQAAAIVVSVVIPDPALKPNRCGLEA
jgi:hypothetical protein